MILFIWSYVAVALLFIGIYAVEKFVRSWRARPPFDRHASRVRDDEFPI